MSKRRITCPECGASLNVADDAPADKKIKCPKCDAVFTIGRADTRFTEAKPTAKRAKVTSTDDDADEPDVRRPSRRRGPRRERQGTPAALVIAAVAGSVLLVAGMAIGAYFLFRAPAPPVAAVAKQPEPVGPGAAAVRPAAPPAPAAVPVPAPDPVKPPKAEAQPQHQPNPIAYQAVAQEDPAKAEARRRLRREWVRANTIEAYEKVGKKNPKWDAAARDCMEAVALLWSGPLKKGHVRVRTWKAAQRALDAGCDDPFIRYLHVRYGDNLRKNAPDDSTAELLQVTDALLASRYPPMRKAHAQHNAAVELLLLSATPDRLERAGRRLDAATALLAEVLKGAGRAARMEALDLCFSLHKQYFNALGDREQAIARVAKILEGDPALEPMLLCVRGYGMIQFAWDARGTGPAQTVTKEKWTLFEERLHQAEKHLRAAWELEPDLYQAPTFMITVAMGLGWTHGEMDVWFEHAMRANSDNHDACQRKLVFLYPQWFGHWSEMLAFGRKCAETKNWEGRLPFQLIEAHDDVARFYGQENWLRRGTGVFPEIQEFYEKFFKLQPDSPYDRAMYAKWAYRCGRYPEAVRLFEALGADDWIDVFDSLREYQAAVADARKRAAQAGK